MAKQTAGTRVNKSSECPNCGEQQLVPIVYGFPSDLTRQLSQKGVVELGGCIISGDDPSFRCQSAPRVVARVRTTTPIGPGMASCSDAGEHGPTRSLAGETSTGVLEVAVRVRGSCLGNSARTLASDTRRDRSRRPDLSVSRRNVMGLLAQWAGNQPRSASLQTLLNYTGRATVAGFDVVTQAQNCGGDRSLGAVRGVDKN